jgi:N-acyl-D-aspartate/D-glutamate deacylase
MAVDLVLKNGRVIDGTGAPRRIANLAIDAGRIVDIGESAPAARRTIDASDLVVSPGFIDPHTHYDAQLCWDRQITPSSWHGVTTVTTGSCGVGVAPCRPHAREPAMWDLVNLESIPFDVLDQGLSWDWEDFPSYMAAAKRRGLAINVAFLAPLTPFRRFVLGDEANERAATAAERAEIARLLEQAVEAGAIGISTSVNAIDIGHAGKPLACRLADREELGAYARVLKRLRRGLTMIHLSIDLRPGDYELVDFLLRESGRPVTWLGLFIKPGAAGEAAFEAMERNAPLFARGSVPQISCRPMYFTFDLRKPFLWAGLGPTARIIDQPLEAQMRAYADPSFRKAMADAVRNQSGPGPVFESCETVEIAHAERADLKALEGRTVAEVAAERGVTASVELMFDLALEDQLAMRFTAPIFNTDEARMARLVADPRNLIALSDGGAHVDQLCDAGYATWLLGHWVREKQALTLERAVQRLTSEPANLFGIADRGRLAVGMKADIAVFDPERVGSAPRGVMRNDLPGGRRRLVMPADGVEFTVVNGEVAFERGIHTGTFSGDVVSSSAAPG